MNRRSSVSRRRSLAWVLPAAVLCLALVYWFALRPNEAAPNIVLITLESVRADHLGCYGYAQPTSPALDALAAEGVVYSDAQAVSSWTLPTHASIFTGLYPGAHQVVGSLSRLDDSYTTLAEVLGARGYQSAGVISGPYLMRAHGLNQGFDHYDESASALSQTLAHAKVTGPEMTSGLNRALARLRGSKRPFFLFAYFWDPHYDYIPPAPFDSLFVTPDCEPIDVTDYERSGRVEPGISPGRIRYVVSQYDGEIRWTDEHLGAFFRQLKAAHLWDDTAIFVLADHGEEFFEHGTKGHKNNLYTESTHIPLIVKYPRGGPSGRDARLVSQVDLFPTILELTGAKCDTPLQGRSLLESAAPADRVVYSELLRATFSRDPSGKWEAHDVTNWQGVRRGEHQLIAVREQQRAELYDVHNDPGEHEDLFAGDNAQASALLALVKAAREHNHAIAQAYGIAGDAGLDQEAIENLRSLGYIH